MPTYFTYYYNEHLHTLQKGEYSYDLNSSQDDSDGEINYRNEDDTQHTQSDVTEDEEEPASQSQSQANTQKVGKAFTKDRFRQPILPYIYPQT